MTKKKPSKCSACNKPWEHHLGIAPTCKLLMECRGALAVIHTWAVFRDGEMFDRKDVEKLCSKVLSKINDRLF